MLVSFLTKRDEVPASCVFAGEGEFVALSAFRVKTQNSVRPVMEVPFVVESRRTMNVGRYVWVCCRELQLIVGGLE